MDRTFVSIDEYLSYNFTKDRLLFIDDIINNLKNKYVTAYPSNADCRLIKYKIIDVDKENSKLIVQPVIMTFVKEKATMGKAGRYVYARTYKLALKDKCTKVSIKLSKEDTYFIKIGIYKITVFDINDIDINKPFKWNTDRKYKGGTDEDRI